ncbi:uncharacterized protein PAN0_001c0840 [Moesziomyces antarcticus]|uniref:Zn(2)-C6 fungal-type domain-containing protein n=1 Tax=Pseudozyma antarctica TaxID=84753 RepID=A0A5C3FI66_PSEA2|nr:uncharacterized protein PAN0_001c0840 [Moesziomyces antarcticus]GAK62639.1 conserved hypothetical protein [Moesziomyces antarcticus]SPO43201.1 uncharacterized protein PSANT_00885 [Moesziomyces antarcticus]
MDRPYPYGGSYAANDTSLPRFSAQGDAAPASTSYDDASEMPRIQKRPRRTHARRSCQMCQQRKARCELPDLEVPSSPLPLPDHQACHRCKTLQISCIVDDANKKKPRKNTADTDPAQPGSSKRRASASVAGDRPRTMQNSSTSASLSSLGDRRSIGSNRSNSSAGMLPSGLPDADADSLKFAGGRELGNQIVYPAEAKLVSKTPDTSDEDEQPDPATDFSARSDRQPDRTNSSETYIKTQDRGPSNAANIDTWERYSTRSRPLTLLTELVPRQAGFASKIFRLVSARATIETDVSEIIPDAKSKILSDWCEENLTLWMPHISNAYQLRQDALQGKQTLSTQLLEQVLYLIALQHIRDPKDDVARFSVVRFVIRDTARLVLTSPRSSKGVEALELLSLFPVDVSAIPGPSRSRIRTDSLISASERVARSVRLDRVAISAAAPYSFFSSTSPLDEFETKRTAMTWASVKTWLTSFTLGDDELFESVDQRFFSDDWSRSLILPLELSQTDAAARLVEAGQSENDLFARKAWSRSRRLGSIGLAMRCLGMRRLVEAFHAIRTTPVDLDESDRLYRLATILDDYKRSVDSIDDEFRDRLADLNQDSHLLRSWLSIETTAGFLLVLCIGILRGLGIDKKEDVQTQELALMIRGENASSEMREFLTRYGEHRILAAEKVLVNTTILCRDARASAATMLSGKGWMRDGQSRTVVPIMNLCGYALEAAFNAMEWHATMFQLWKTPPKRAESWRLVFSDLIAAMLSLDPMGSIENGSIPATCAFILQGMLKVIVLWTQCSRNKDIQRTTSTSSANLNGRDGSSNGRDSDRYSGQSLASAAPAADLARYEALIQHDMATSRTFDAVQSFDSSANAALMGNSNTMRSDQHGPRSNPYSMTASMFAADVSSSQGNDSSLNGAGPAFASNASESLAAALPRSVESQAKAPGVSTEQGAFSAYRAPPMSSMDGSSASGTVSPMPLAAQYTAVGNGNGTALDGGAAVPGANFSMRNEEGRPSVAYDSLDFIRGIRLARLYPQ